MKVVAYASRQHYADHLAPVYAALPDELHGGVYGPRDEQAWGRQLPRRSPGVLYLVASYVDAAKVGGPFVYLEHGAGQSYGGDPESARNVSYAGGDGRAFKDCRLILAPGEECAERHRSVQSCPVVAVGCPYLDTRLRADVGAAWGRQRVAFTFHWDASAVCPEARSALPHYENRLEGAVADLRANGWEVWGHGHPRAQGALKAMWSRLGVPWVTRARVFDEADLLVADNTSLLPEFASLGRPVVFLNAPWYRADVWHGGRFWDWPDRQISISSPDELGWGISEAHVDPSGAQVARARMVAQVYAYTDGSSSVRAARAISEVVDAGSV